MSIVKYNSDIEIANLNVTSGTVTISNPDGDSIVLDTEAWKKVKEVVDAPYSFSYTWEENGEYPQPYFDLDYYSIRGLDRTEIKQHVISNELDEGNCTGVMTFSEPIYTFPGLFYKYSLDMDYAGYASRVSTVNVPEGVTTLPRACFYYSQLSITLPTSIQNIQDYALALVYPSQEVLDLTNVFYFGRNAIEIPLYSGKNYGIRIKPSSIQRIGPQAFSGDIHYIEDDDAEAIITPDSEGYIEFAYGPLLQRTYSGYLQRGMSGPECVAAGTQILIDSIGNTKNVEDLKEGDIVLTKDGDSYIEATIDKVVIKTHFNYYILTLEDGTSVTISDDHAIMTADGWKSLHPIITEHPKDVNRLTEKDSVQTRNGLVKIKSIEHQHLTEEPLTMYNIGVSGYYNYFANNILVYECSGSE